MHKHLVISTSGNPDSNSRRMGRVAFAHLQKQKAHCEWVDIREMDLPLCDADKCYGMPGSKKLGRAIELPTEFSLPRRFTITMSRRRRKT